MVLSLVPGLFIGLGMRLDGPWTVAVERPLWKACAQRFYSQSRMVEPGSLGRADKWFVREVQKLLSDIDWAGCLCCIHLLIKMKVELEVHTKFVCLLNRAILNRDHEQWKWSWMFILNLLTALVELYWTGASSTVYSAVIEITSACSLRGATWRPKLGHILDISLHVGWNCNTTTNQAWS